MICTYRIAKYFRLSHEDNDLKDTDKSESNSISNQRHLIDSFIAAMPELSGAQIYEYCDDGWSGKNFERPDVQRMLEDVRKGKINCIIVKDISRFGRDYLTVGNYISRVFPFLQVRFIAINDGIDSSRPQDMDSLETSFKTLLYDLYSRDLSRKVRTNLYQRAKRGEFLSPFAPYGYRKDGKNKNRLQIDPEAAEIVRRIFHMAAKGVKVNDIAKALNREGIATRMQYKRDSGCSRTSWPSVSNDNFWTEDAVRIILRDERYLGKTVYGKRKRDVIGRTHSVKTERNDWIVVEGMHPSLVSPEEFEAAQRIMKPFSERTGLLFHNRPLDRRVHCGVCGHVMDRINSSNPYFCCNTARSTERFACPDTKIPENDILDLLYEEIRFRAKVVADLDKLRREQEKRERASLASIQKELSELGEKSKRQRNLLQELYESYACGTIQKEEYVVKKEAVAQRKREIEARIRDIEAMQTQHDDESDSYKKFTDMFRQYADMDIITEHMVGEAVDHIVIYPNNEIRIIWKFQNEFEALRSAFGKKSGK